MELGKNSPLLTIVHDGWDFFGEILEELVVKAGEAEKTPNSANIFRHHQSSLWPLNPSWSHQVLLETWYNPEILWSDQRPSEAVFLKSAYICWWQWNTLGVSVCVYATNTLQRNKEYLLRCNSKNVEISQGNAYIIRYKQVLRGDISGLQDCLLLFSIDLCFLQA